MRVIQCVATLFIKQAKGMKRRRRYAERKYVHHYIVMLLQVQPTEATSARRSTKYQRPHLNALPTRPVRLCP